MSARLEQSRKPFRQRGAGLLEFVIAAPVTLMLILGAIQMGLVYRAKTTLNLAAFEAARGGALHNADVKSMDDALARAMTPLYARGTTVLKIAAGRALAKADLTPFGWIAVLNPTTESFNDFALMENGRPEIPNNHLLYRDGAPGPESGQSIQDANLLKIRVTYGYPLQVPFIKQLLLGALKWTDGDPLHQAWYALGRLPVTATATVRMQTPAAWHGGYLSLAEVENLVEPGAGAGGGSGGSSGASGGGENGNEPGTGQTPHDPGQGGNTSGIPGGASGSPSSGQCTDAPISSPVPGGGLIDLGGQIQQQG